MCQSWHQDLLYRNNLACPSASALATAIAESDQNRPSEAPVRNDECRNTKELESAMHLAGDREEKVVLNLPALCSIVCLNGW